MRFKIRCHAVKYKDGLWLRLIRFLDDPRISLDNNQSERAMRGPVLGQKNHYGSKSEAGTKAAALFYSFVETCKLIGLSPNDYLTETANRALLCPGTVALPTGLLAERRERENSTATE